jgi:class 3 adenylate cyclase
LYEETTIFFADLAGLTSWSSKRTPIEVFELLETIYSAFDIIAAKRGVFKVETIGDCYVAATGIPQPQADHAVILVKFAQDCMTQFSQLTHDLVATLGEDTAQLEMRVGLHSGATTAGVLRGAKGRFQLFGDTVNTAARMESNGVRGRIHVSQATANALIAKGKSHWLTAREDKVIAKGKGEMQTYFVAPKTDKSVFTAPSFDETSSVDSNEALERWARKAQIYVQHSEKVDTNI